MKIADLTLYGSNAPLSTASPLPTAVEHASVAGYEYTAPQQVNAFTSGYENILDMGSCTGYDDAEAIIKIVKDSNKDITGLTAYGRNYIGNWAGATANYWDRPNRDFLNQIWRNQTSPMGLVKYSQDANGNIIEETTFTHPANRYLFNAQNNRIWTHYRDYANEARGSSGANIRELNTILSRRGNQ